MFERIYSLKIFEGIEKEIIDKIVNDCEVKEFMEGEIIMMEKEPSNGEGYIIKLGNVEIIIGGQKVAELGVGDIFGEIALLSEDNRTATVRVTKNCKVMVLKLDHLMELINNGSDIINKTVLSRIEENLARY